MNPSVDIILKRPDKTYTPGSAISGVIQVESPTGQLSYNAIQLIFDGQLTLAHGLEGGAFSNQDKNELIHIVMNVASSGKCPRGRTEIAFDFPLDFKQNNQLFETYHGILATVKYTLTCEIQRGMFSKALHKDIEIVIVNYDAELHEPKPLDFEMTSAKLKKAVRQNPASLNIATLITGGTSKGPVTDNPPAQQVQQPISFKFKGHFNSRICNVVEPITGEIEIVNSTLAIRSVELQLVRAETIASTNTCEVTEIQNIQIADGDILPGTCLPIYMVLPRLFVCSTLRSALCNMEFEANVVVLFRDQSLVSENIPIILYRAHPQVSLDTKRQGQVQKLWTDVY
ncbi:MAG: putative vacuolar protein sorting-associated protein 26 family protein [Streblomastix strix]|uniref:Putative vacuolar protein sorting-associated protein 26 family protein n=1 Tax=Streblomastix strix TaxID=222440 RepID=A0A5J4VE01_9EUKA|nr:MAG: putative vacuolar protein sorting-associated protein 26 family protein [Streblomastix strix]